MAGLPDFLDKQRGRITESARRRQWQTRTGTITEVDPGRGLARVKLQDGNPEFLTGWIPWAEHAAGAFKTHYPPSVGQQVMVTSESGDLHDGVIQTSLNSDANARPSSAGDEYVLASVGQARIAITGGGTALELKVGDGSIKIDEGGAVMVLKVGPTTATLTAESYKVEATRVDLN